jgi:hypothetical protein
MEGTARTKHRPMGTTVGPNKSQTEGEQKHGTKHDAYEYEKTGGDIVQRI